jgi:hypothetical protein
VQPPRRGVAHAGGHRVGDAHRQMVAGGLAQARAAQQERPHQAVGLVVEGVDVERGRVALVARGRREQCRGHHLLRRPLAHHQRAGRQVAQPLVAGRQHAAHHGGEPDRREQEVDQAHRGPQERLLEPLGRAVGADHPQPERRLAQRAPPPQGLEGGEPDHQRRQAGHGGEHGRPRALGRHAQRPGQQGEEQDRHPQRQDVDRERQGAGGHTRPLEVEHDRLGRHDRRGAGGQRRDRPRRRRLAPRNVRHPRPCHGRSR